MPHRIAVVASAVAAASRHLTRHLIIVVMLFAALALACGLKPHASHPQPDDRGTAPCLCAGAPCDASDPEPDHDHGDCGHCHCPSAVAQLPNAVAPLLLGGWFDELRWPIGPPALTSVVFPPDPPPARRS